MRNLNTLAIISALTGTFPHAPNGPASGGQGYRRSPEAREKANAERKDCAEERMTKAEEKRQRRALRNLKTEQKKRNG